MNPVKESFHFPPLDRLSGPVQAVPMSKIAAVVHLSMDGVVEEFTHSSPFWDD
ncbi:hypothetical protein GCM10009560_12530 [Nonomuraea longicatena]|uniref:Uncharacterized protein n=1 Tax=Nonomuraea longicatena TaxID=83682 RepID=A0ABN1NUL5_9ACTN